MLNIPVTLEYSYSNLVGKLQVDERELEALLENGVAMIIRPTLLREKGKTKVIAVSLSPYPANEGR